MRDPDSVYVVSVYNCIYIIWYACMSLYYVLMNIELDICIYTYICQCVCVYVIHGFCTNQDEGHAQSMSQPHLQI